MNAISLAVASAALLAAAGVPREGESAGIAGQVTFTGEVPEVSKLAVSKDVEVCGEHTREFVPVKVTEDGGLTDVVVFVDTKGEPLGEWKHPEGGYVLDQTGCFFQPYITVFPRDPDVKLQIRNSDPVLHNIHGYELIGRARRSIFNLSQPEGAETAEQEISVGKRSHAILLKCDAHDFMNGYIFVADNPYYALAGPDGKYSIDGVPAGKHTVSAWHPTLGTLSQKEVEVAADGVVSVDFEFEPVKSTGRRRR